MLLFSLHGILAVRTGVEELELSEPEAAKLAKAAHDVAKHYTVLGTLSPQTAAWLNFAQVAGIVYGPRAVSFIMRKRNEAAAEPAPVAQPVGMAHAMFATGNGAHLGSVQ